MKPLIACSLLLALAAAPAPAQEPAPETPAPAPRIVCDQPEFDFGTLDNSETVEHTFVLRNAGDLTLEIAQARPSCGCTVASISERNVPPGGESRITSRLSLAGRQGFQHKLITIDSNDPRQPQLALTLKGTAAVALDVQPPRIMQAQLAAGTQPTNAVTLNGIAGTAFQVTAVDAGNDRFKASVETLEEGRMYRILIWPSQPLAPGQLDATITVRTDHPKRPSVEIPIVLIANTELTVAPRELILSTASEEPVTRYIIVRGQQGSTFKIHDVELPDPDIQVAVTPFGNQGHRVQLSNLRPRADLNQKVVRIITDIPGQPPLEVPIRIEPAKAP